MLTSDLLRVKIKKEQIHPRWIDEGSPKYLRRAQEFIEIFKAHLGKKRGELEEQLRDVVGEETDYIVQRGMIKLLMDSAEFEIASKADPREIRRRAFQLAAENYPVTPMEPDRRREILQTVAEEFQMTPEEVEASLFGDLQEAHVLKAFSEMTPRQLLQRYNLALTQALLFRAESLKINLKKPTPQRLRQLYRYLKFFQLMATAEPREDGDFCFKVDGPLSLFRFHQKYGLQMAKFLPALLLCEDWSLEADIRWEYKNRKKRKLKFSLDSSAPLKSHYPDKGVYVTQEEQAFRDNWSEKKLGWKLKPRAEIFKLGPKDTLITDYQLVAPDGRSCFLAILGFWHPRWLQRKLQWVEKYAPPNIIFSAPAKLQTSKDPLPPEVENRVHFYKYVIQSKKITELAEKYAIKES